MLYQPFYQNRPTRRYRQPESEILGLGNCCQVMLLQGTNKAGRLVSGQRGLSAYFSLQGLDIDTRFSRQCGQVQDSRQICQPFDVQDYSSLEVIENVLIGVKAFFQINFVGFVHIVLTPPRGHAGR